MPDLNAPLPDLHFPKLTIRNDSMAAFRARVWLDDVEVTNWCNRVTLDLPLKEHNQVTLHMLVSEVDVESAANVVELNLSRPTPDVAVGVQPAVEFDA